jgi:septum formation protein
MLYLASQSPRRQSILIDLNVHFSLLLPKPNEDAEALEEVIPHESSKDYVLRVTLLKLAAAVKRLHQQELDWHPILCADTTVSLQKDGEDIILGKPKDNQDALKMLSLLNSQCHEVHTAIAMQNHLGQAPEYLIHTSKVYFANNSENKLKAYVATQEPMGKSGSYAIQGIGSSLIEKIEGSHSGIMGLPIFETCQLLEKAKIAYILYP